MKQGWEIKKLGEVCTIGGGSTPSKTNKDFWENGAIPWFTIEDIREQGRKIRYTQKHITEKALNKTRLFPPKTTLLCCTASIGEYAISEVEITSNQQFNGIVVKDSGILNPYYIFYFAATLKEKLLKLSSKTTIDFVSTGKVKELTIPVPSLLEQGRIVGVLDAAFAKIDALKENAQKNLENAKALFQQVLKQELTPKPNWQTKKLGEVCKYIKEQGSYSNLPYVGMEDIEPETNKYLGKLIPKNVKSTTFKFHQGYVLFGRLRPYLRKVLTPKFEGHCSTEIFPIQPCQDINCEFLRFWFLDNIDDINRTCTGARMPRANMNDVLNFVISYPQIDEQEEIVLKIENITQKSNKVIANAEKTIAECDALKQAVLRRAFNGEL